MLIYLDQERIFLGSRNGYRHQLTLEESPLLRSRVALLAANRKGVLIGSRDAALGYQILGCFGPGIRSGLGSYERGDETPTARRVLQPPCTSECGGGHTPHRRGT